MFLGWQAQVDQCVHMLKTKKEVIERNEKQVAALLERVPRALSSRDRRVLQKPVDEQCPHLACKLMREMQEKRERVAELLNEEMSP